MSARSVVLDDVPPYFVAVGIPARVVNLRRLIRRLKAPRLLAAIDIARLAHAMPLELAKLCLVATDWKSAAVEQWTSDPCGPETGALVPGTKDYAKALLEGRAEYAPWMTEELGYAGTAGLRVLDVGCGQGIDLMLYAMSGAVATGVDLTPRHAELARRHLASLGLEAEVVDGDAEELPFPDKQFDRVSSNGVLHHTPDIESALRSVYRVLRPGGQARVIVYNRNSFHYWITQVLDHGLLRRKLFKEGSMEGVMSTTVEKTSVDARPLVKVYSRKDMKALLEAAGFVGVSAHARHYRIGDTQVTKLLARVIRPVKKPSFLDRLGRIGGWYVIATGTRPSV